MRKCRIQSTEHCIPPDLMTHLIIVSTNFPTVWDSDLASIYTWYGTDHDSVLQLSLLVDLIHLINTCGQDCHI